MTSQRFNKTIERKKEIIKAAMQLFSEKGYAQTSMRDIARTIAILIQNKYYLIQQSIFILKSVVIVILLFYMILLLRLKIR